VAFQVVYVETGEQAEDDDLVVLSPPWLGTEVIGYWLTLVVLSSF